MMPAAALVVSVSAAVIRGDWILARHLAREAVLARVSALYDDGAPIDVTTLPEAPERTG